MLRLSIPEGPLNDLFRGYGVAVEDETGRDHTSIATSTRSKVWTQCIHNYL